jgi:alkanesulfonate monooxygenase SsuD/methylene tetrahydromethanopterin reductase-like flavin-dependent oxidoreductase (luciferase family)
VLQASAIGTVGQVQSKLRAFIERTAADEVIIAGSMFDPEARKRSITMTMEAAASL